MPNELEEFQKWLREHFKEESIQNSTSSGLRLAFRAGWVAAQQSVHPTVLPVREIETVCPHCSLVFDVPVPEPHSG